jgi:hypothetical protein
MCSYFQELYFVEGELKKGQVKSWVRRRDFLVEQSNSHAKLFFGNGIGKKDRM